jgi:Beta-xylosidase
MLRAEYWERFDEVKKRIPFQYIRCHGLLCDELGLVRVDEWEGRRRLSYNYAYLDQILDSMLEHGARPFLELGFMPEALASGSQTVFWWKGNVTPPADFEAWAELLRALFSHWIGRYSIEEVRRWPVEVWNEPNLPIFWKDADQRAYFRLYEASVRAIKALDPGIRVGGPAICGGADQWIDDFLGFVKERGLPLDFLTRHLYMAQKPSARSPEFTYQSLVPPNVPLAELASVRERMESLGFGGLELHITEFNTSYDPLCPVHDTPLNAAYLARVLSEAGDYASALSYWTFCDLFEEKDVPRSLFHGGFGLIARNGIPKPTLHLFAFFQKLGDVVVQRGPNCLVTRREGGCLALVAWNPVMEADPRPPLVLSLELPWEDGRAIGRRSRVHEGAGNPWGLWRKLGRPRFPDRDTVEFLRAAAQPAVELVSLEPREGLVSLRLELERNEVTLVEIVRLVDESESYLGLDDSLIDGYARDY